MKLFKDFKAFAMKGNVVDLAVGIIIGAAFGKIVSSLVADIIMPIVGMAISEVNFTDLAITLKAASGDTPAVLIKYGNFLQTIIDFVIITFSIFLMVSLITKIRTATESKEEEKPKAPTTKDILTEIRDLLKRDK